MTLKIHKNLSKAIASNQNLLQYLNRREDPGGRVPHRELAFLHRDLGDLPSEVEC